MNGHDEKFARDKFLVNQKWRSFREKYYVYDEQNRQLFTVERPFRLLFRRNITVYHDATKKDPVLFIDQDHFWELFDRTYTVRTPDGEQLARLSRNNFSSLFRRSWEIRAATGNLIVKVREDTVALAVVRRLLNFLPFGDLLMKTDFHFIAYDPAGNERKIGSFDRRIGLFDKYVLDLSADSQRTLDRRVGLAAAILLDTAEKR